MRIEAMTITIDGVKYEFDHTVQTCCTRCAFWDSQHGCIAIICELCASELGKGYFIKKEVQNG